MLACMHVQRITASPFAAEGLRIIIQDRDSHDSQCMYLIHSICHNTETAATVASPRRNLYHTAAGE